MGRCLLSLWDLVFNEESAGKEMYLKGVERRSLAG